jgi:FecR protein
MKKITLLLILITTLALPAFSLMGEVVYVEGTVDIKSGSGGLDYADIGMPVETGDSIITGYDGYAEIEMEDGSTVKVNEDSIFKLDSVQQDNKRRNSFQLVLGSASYKFTKTMKESEPQITTPSTVCGLRGTEFSVFAGIDGSALYVVDEGSIAVSSKGSEVELGAEQGVRVNPGETPGEPFEIKRGKVDYSTFKLEAEESFFSNPASTVFLMMDQLAEYADLADESENLFLANKEAMVDLRAQLDSLEGDERKTFYKDFVFAEEVKLSGLKHNVRYYALSAKSLRRFVIGSMYIQMKTMYMMTQENPEFLDFLNAYYQFLDMYETRIVPYLVEADIR